MNVSGNNSIFSLSRLGVLRLTGCDVLPFLQGQVTLDVGKLDHTLRPAGYCDPKGRLLALFYLTLRDSSVYAVTSHDTLESLTRRLTLYTLRRDVRICIDDTHTVCGTLGPHTFSKDDALYTKGTATLALTENPSGGNADDTSWWEAASCEFIPFVFSQSQGKFLPQSLNLDLNGAVSFNKGCYVGQEIVSRIHSLGTPARRLALYQGSQRSFAAGSDLMDSEGTPKAVTVYSAGTRALVECSVRDTPQTLYLQNGKALSLVSRQELL